MAFLPRPFFPGAPSAPAVPHPGRRCPALPCGQLSYKESGNKLLLETVVLLMMKQSSFRSCEPDTSQDFKLFVCISAVLGGGECRAQSVSHASRLPTPHRFPTRGQPPPQERLPRVALARTPHGSPPCLSSRRAGSPGLTADHPAAKGSVTAKQSGSQQQRDHAAHRGKAAAAAGVAPGQGGLCPPRSQGSNPGASLPPCRPYSSCRSPASWSPARIAFGRTRTVRVQGGGAEVRGSLVGPRYAAEAPVGPHRSSSILSGASSERGAASARPDPGSQGSSSSSALQTPAYIPASRGSGPSLVTMFNYFVSPAMRTIPAPPLKTGATFKTVHSAAPPPPLHSWSLLFSFANRPEAHLCKMRQFCH